MAKRLPLPLELSGGRRGDQLLADGAVLLGGLAETAGRELVEAIASVERRAPFRRFTTPGGRTMSVAMTNCGDLGWVSDRRGYRYEPDDPQTGDPWPAMPALFADLAVRAARGAGFAGYAPDVCLINRYEPGARLSLHQDRDERDRRAPIVSVSLGVSAVFLWGGPKRSDPARRVPLLHGDVVVWGGPARMTFHGVQALAGGEHPLTGGARYNLTFRRAR